MKRPVHLVLLLLCTPAWAATYYLSTAGADMNPGTTADTAFATFTRALAAMSPCDTLVVEDGYYYDSVSIRTTNLNGNIGGTGCYTTIEAATPWRVTVDSSAITPAPNGTFFFYGASYVQVIGIKAAGNPNLNTVVAGGGADLPWFVDGSNHIKLQQTAGFNAPCWGNTDVYSIGPGSSYVLVEDSHAWGCGRYKFMSYQSDHVIFRRDVARHDYHDVTGWSSPGPGSSISGWGRQCGDFVNYDGWYTLFQNDIAIDSGLVNQETGRVYGGLWSEHNDSLIDTPIEFEGSILDNVFGVAGIQDAKQSQTHTFNNDVIVNSEGGMMIGTLWWPVTITSVTFTGTEAELSSTDIPYTDMLAGNYGYFTGMTGIPAVLNGSQALTYKVLSCTPINGTSNGCATATGTITVPSTQAAGGPYSTNGTFHTFTGMTLPTVSISHMTMLGLTGTTLGDYPDSFNSAKGIGIDGNCAISTCDTSQTVLNNIFQDIASTQPNSSAVADYVTSNYDYYYLNTANFGTTAYPHVIPVAGVHDVLNTNPQLKYITREEAGSPVYGMASDGGNIGATILYEIGTTGTLYGDPGYDTTTATSLWPFPNEAVIKSDMASFSMVNPITGSTINGSRGFAASGNGLYGGPVTLTSYIWEALGNPCPTEICTPQTAPPPPTGLTGVVLSTARSSQ